jgi:hypothetical protein
VPLTAGAVPGQLTGRYVPDAAGVYRVDVALTGPGGETETVTRFVRAGTESLEASSPTRNEALLVRLAEATGGRYFADGDVSGLDTLLRFAGTGVRAITVLPLWNLPLFFLILVTCKLIEWGLRRRWGRL